MDRADRSGLGLAVGGHLLLLAALTVTIARRPPPVHVEPAPMDVQLVDAVGLQSAAPTPATEAPRQSEAPEVGPPVEDSPPPPAPQPRPAPATPAPPPPAPAKVAKPVAPTPAPVPAKSVAPPSPPSKAAPAKPAARLSSDFLRDLPATSNGKRATGARLGSDFLKGLPSASAGKGQTARAAITGAAMNGLAAAIKRQVQPCYDLGSLGGTPAMEIVTTLRLRYNRDGSVAGTPQVIAQTGGGSYARQMAEVAQRAVLRCSPIRLPAELYEGGWDELDFRFTPGQMR